MNKSESLKELAAALAKAQGEMRGAIKDSANPFFKSKYADLASVVEAIREPFSKHGLSYVQCTETSDKDEVRVETILMHASGEWISSVLALPVVKADAQGFGSALTYARRYGLSAATGVAPEDDDGNAASRHKPSDGAMASLSAKRQSAIMDIVVSVKESIKADKIWDAYQCIETAHIDTDEKVALWSQLDSKERSALKRMKEAENKGEQ